MKKLLVTGSSGLIGSECVIHFDEIGWWVYGVDNNMRADFFGQDGDTTWNLQRVQGRTHHFEHRSLDIRDRRSVLDIMESVRPDFIIHCAAQPSHELATSRPFDDFDVNAVGTLNFLEAARRFVPDSVFGFMSTNKVYGDAPNELSFVETQSRYDYADVNYYQGIREDMRIDASKHSLFGASKVAADVMVQEYGRYFGMKTVCFRGGCLTGPHHSAVEIHGFLAYLTKCIREGRHYRILGYKGKQVRDNIHSADVCCAFEAFYNNPRCGEVYNLGGGRSNSISVIEAISLAEDISGKKLDYDYADCPRPGDHICYISDVSKFRSHFPDWKVTRTIDDIMQQLVDHA